MSHTRPGPARPATRRIIREPECEQLTGLCRWARYRMEKSGEFPKRLKMGNKAVGWFEDEIVAWQSALEANR